jgi:hypothetical protein
MVETLLQDQSPKEKEKKEPNNLKVEAIIGVKPQLDCWQNELVH